MAENKLDQEYMSNSEFVGFVKATLVSIDDKLTSFILDCRDHRKLVNDRFNKVEEDYNHRFLRIENDIDCLDKCCARMDTIIKILYGVLGTFFTGLTGMLLKLIGKI